MTNETQTQPAGWHQDPWGVEPLRWWDGEQWTEHTSGLAAALPTQQDLDSTKEDKIAAKEAAKAAKETAKAEKAAAKEVAKQQRAAVAKVKNVDKADKRRAKNIEKRTKLWDKTQAQRNAAFAATTKGAARNAFGAGHQVFQFTAPLAKQTGRTIMLDSAKSKNVEFDTSNDVNGVIAEGWEFSNMTQAFRPTTEVSRDKFMSSGQQTAVSGVMMATYVFIRKEENRVEPTPLPSVYDVMTAWEQENGLEPGDEYTLKQGIAGTKLLGQLGKCEEGSKYPRNINKDRAGGPSFF
jgi:hypothetical protein